MPVDEQIYLLVKIVEVTEEERHQKSQIISSLEEWLSLEFPGCCLHLFGSSITGLAFRNDSDLDIFLEIPQSMKLKMNRNIYEYQRNTKCQFLLRFLTGEETPSFTVNVVPNDTKYHPLHTSTTSTTSSG